VSNGPIGVYSQWRLRMQVTPISLSNNCSVDTLCSMSVGLKKSEYPSSLFRFPELSQPI
jgi:hypothetical protein